VFSCAGCGCGQLRFFPEQPGPCHCGSQRFTLTAPSPTASTGWGPGNQIIGGLITGGEIAVQMDPGTSADFHGLRIVDTPVGFDMAPGASAGVHGLSHEFTDPAPKRRRGWRKNRKAQAD
jgi:hypothetical protein